MVREHAFVLVPAQALVAQHLTSFQQPPRQRPGSFSVEKALEKLRNPPSSIGQYRRPKRLS